MKELVKYDFINIMQNKYIVINILHFISLFRVC